MPKKMLINVIEPEEIRIAVLDDGKLDELYVERASRTKLVGNIYKAKLVNVEPSLDAAFVDFGGGRNGFLHASDIAASYLGDGKKGPKDSRQLKDVFKRGADVMVQVAREGIGKKAPRVTTYISLPGRYLVLMPELSRQGVSRKIEDDKERGELREMLRSLKPPDDMGFIIRTAGRGRTKRDLQRDMNYLLRLWRGIRNRFKNAKQPGLLHMETDLVKRAIRDIYTTDIDEIWIDSEDEYRKVIEFMKLTMPRQCGRVTLFDKAEPLFHHYKLEVEIEKVYQRQVPLKSGGSIVIDQTEALVAIDVNSGKSVKEKNIEDTAFKTNLEAAEEIARQLRLRDMGGVMVIDFIDMESTKNQRRVEEALWASLKNDRARLKMLRMSKFGIVEMTRQRMRESLHRSHYENCPYCMGTGRIKTAESVGLSAFRDVRSSVKDPKVSHLQVSVSPGVADYLQNEKRAPLVELEETSQTRIEILSVPALSMETVQFQAYDREGRRLKNGNG